MQLHLAFVARLQEGRLLVAAGALKVVQLPDVLLQLLLSFLLGPLLLGPHLDQSRNCEPVTTSRELPQPRLSLTRPCN